MIGEEGRYWVGNSELMTARNRTVHYDSVALVPDCAQITSPYGARESCPIHAHVRLGMPRQAYLVRAEAFLRQGHLIGVCRRRFLKVMG